jgi:two-component system, OmpR family, sensor kinase
MVPDIHAPLWLNLLQKLLMVETTSLESALQQTADLLTTAFASDKIDIFLHEPSEAMLVAYGTSHTPMGDLQKALGLDRLPLYHGGRAVAVFQENIPYLTGHLEDDDLELQAVKTKLGIRSFMAVPFEVASERRGVVMVSSATPDQYTLAHLEFLQAATRWVGVIAHRAELLEAQIALTVAQTRRRVAETLLTQVAHDIKNFITPMALRLASLKRHAQTQQRTRDEVSATEAQQILQHFYTLVNTLLDVARLDEAIFVLNCETTDMIALIEQAVSMLRPYEAAFSLAMPARLEVWIDPVRFQMVLTNLLSNALRVQPEGQPIEIMVEVDRGEQPSLVIEIRDAGEGIEAEEAAHLFERYRAGPGSVGLGLGLYVCREIVTAHGGTLSVTSTVGKGSTFTIRLPLP